MITQVVAILLILFFFFLIYMSTKTWRYHHVLFLFFNCAAAIAFCIFASMSLKVRVTGRKIITEYTSRLAKVAEEGETLLHGDLSVVIQEKDSVLALREKFYRDQRDRGRVWRNSKPNGGFQNGTITLSIVLPEIVEPPAAPAPADPAAADPANPAPADPANPAQPADPANPNPAQPAQPADPANQPVDGGPIPAATEPAAPAAAPPPVKREHGIPADMILYGFIEKETEVAGEKVTVPDWYVGEFRVRAVTEETVTLAPTFQLDADQVQAIQTLATWSLYEVMPIDGHHYFAKGESAEGYLFGEVDADELKTIMTNRFNRPAEDYAKGLVPFLHDGRPIEAIKQEIPDFSPLPEETQMRVKFVKRWDSADVDSEVTRDAVDGGYFDSSGRAVVQSLRRGGKVELGVGDFAVFDLAKGQELVDQGIAEKVELIYVRKLRDYEHSFHSIFARFLSCGEDIRRISVNVARLQEAEKDAKAQQGYREVEKAKLEHDLRRVKYESDSLVRQTARLAAQEATLRAALSQAYRENIALAQKLAEIQLKMAAEINQRTNAAPADPAAPAPAPAPAAGT